MKTYIVILFSTLLLTGSGLYAQPGEVRATPSIVFGMPTGGLKDVAGNNSLRGFDLSLLYGINEKWSVGLTAAYQDFYEKFPRALYKMEDGSDISAVLSNSIQVIPILATVRYTFNAEAVVQPYVSAGVGGAIISDRQFVGEYPNSDTKFGFAARPEAGVFVPFRRGGPVGLNFGVNYSFAPYNKYGLDNISYLGVKLGIGFPLRD